MGFSKQGLLGHIGYIPPGEAEAIYWAQRSLSPLTRGCLELDFTQKKNFSRPGFSGIMRRIGNVDLGPQIREL